MGAVFCDDPTPHGPHVAQTDLGRCPGRGLQEVCASCGRHPEQVPGSDCEQPEWHQVSAIDPQPEPALQGDDLARHLRQRLTYAEDQVQYATQLIVAMLLQLPEPLVRITGQQLQAAEGRALQTWRDPAGDETVYRVVQP